MTLLDIITAALGRIAVLQANETPTAADAALGLRRVNNMLDQWKAESLLVYALQRTTYTITSGVSTYNVGSGQTVNVPRPVIIEGAGYVDTSITPNLERPLQPMTDDAYRQIPQKTLQSTLPTSFFYNPLYPSASLFLWPVPTSTTLQGTLYAPIQVAEFAAVNDSFALQPGYREAIETNLALKLCPDFEKTPHPVLVQDAIQAMAIIQVANKKLLDLSFDPGSLGSSRRPIYDIRIGP